MKKVILLLVIIVSGIVLSCTTQNQCSAYGEKQRYQKNPSSWAK